jgi:hypothetical protein
MYLMNRESDLVLGQYNMNLKITKKGYKTFLNQHVVKKNLQQQKSTYQEDILHRMLSPHLADSTLLYMVYICLRLLY